MIPRFGPDYRLEDLACCFLPAGSANVAQLEHAFAKRSGHAEAIAFKYGRSGLYYLLRALGAKSKRVIMPSYTCVVVAHAVTLSGNIPVFLDNRLGALQPDPAQYLAAVTDDPANTAMIIPTHLFGIVEETADLYRQIKSRYPHVFVLQDCAHGYFGQDSTGHVVTEWGDGALFGMNISKLVNSVRGGMLTLRDAKLALKTRTLAMAERSQPGMLDSLKARLYAFAAGLAFTPSLYGLIYWLTRNTRLLSSETDYYQADKIDLPSDFRQAMSPFEAGIGLRSLARYDRRIARRRQLAESYAHLLQPLRELGLLQFSTPQAGYTWSHFPVCVSAETRDALRLRIERELKMEVGLIVDYSVAHLPAYAEHQCLTPRAQATVSEILNLPLCLYENIVAKTQASGRAIEDNRIHQTLAKLEAIFRDELLKRHGLLD